MSTKPSIVYAILSLVGRDAYAYYHGNGSNGHEKIELSPLSRCAPARTTFKRKSHSRSDLSLQKVRKVLGGNKRSNNRIKTRPCVRRDRAIITESGDDGSFVFIEKGGERCEGS